MLFLVFALSALSLAAFAYAAIVAVGLVRERAAMRARIERATRPVHGPAIACAPVIYRNRLGED